MINKFSGEHRFLSNFYPTLVHLDGWWYTTTEAAYQAAKTTDLEARRPFSKMSASEAKKAGRGLALREDWEDIKVQVMADLLCQKFRSGSNLAIKLDQTQDQELVEGNTWSDTFWGVCNGVGENHLGKLLMGIRSMNRQ